MSGLLLDTNVLSEFNRRGEPDRLVKQWPEAADTDSLYASVLTFGEGRILPIDEQVANRWGSLCAEAQLKGRPLSVIDALLAATALQHNLTIVSRNVSDFSIIGLTVVSPWES